MARTYFDVMGVAPTFQLRSDELEKQFLALSKKVHPDRFARAAPHERLQALQSASELNDAYKVLRDPARRAEYLLKLSGIDVADEKGASVQVSPSLLGEMMELNEQLAEAHDQPEVVRALAEAVKERRALAMRAVEEGFRAVESGDSSKLAEVAQAVIAMRYHARFLEQAEAAKAEDDDARGGL